MLCPTRQLYCACLKVETYPTSRGTESFGTLLEKVEYNRQHEYLTESRENDDVAYITQLKKEYGLD